MLDYNSEVVVVWMIKHLFKKIMLRALPLPSLTKDFALFLLFFSRNFLKYSRYYKKFREKIAKNIPKSLVKKDRKQALRIFVTFVIIFSARISFAQSLIRDAEIENFLHDLSRPIFVAANLKPENIKIYIVNDDTINAFVSGGQNIFINTGLIRKYKTPDTLIGVIAHEVGHITGGHLARSGEGAAEAEKAMILSYILGIGAIAGGAPDAGAALIMGGSQSAQRLFMKFTRTQEEAADQYAIAYLQQMSYPPDGLIKLLEFFDQQMIGYKGEIDEYLLSHPVSKKRIDLLKERTKDWNFSDKKINNSLQKQMDRVNAKLEGFIDDPDLILLKYQNSNDENSNYVKAIAYFKKGEISNATKLLDPIIEQNKSDGFLYELKGQILFESGAIEEAILAYNQSIKLIDKTYNGMAKISFAASILALNINDSDLINLAIKNLKEAKKTEGETPLLFRYLSDAYNKIGAEGKSYLALAEYNFLIGEKDKAKKYAKEAQEKLPKSEKLERLRADDLLELMKEDKEDRKDKKK
jgi:predicted Zn-dependent protease